MAEHAQKCFACNIPETEEINEGRRSGVGIGTMLRYLWARGHKEATRNKLQHHFEARHHEKKSA